MYIFIWILSFIILVILHEMGHLVAAKKMWVKVYEFWLWIPPKIKTLWTDKSWTKYTLNALPLWWFIRPKWEDFQSDSEIYDKDSFHAQPFWKKVIILLWWVFMNLLIAFVLFFVAFWIWIKPVFIIPDSANSFHSTSYLFPTTSFAQKVWYIKPYQAQPLKVDWIIKQNNTLTSQINIQTWDIITTIWWQKVNTKNAWKLLSQYLWKQVEIWIKRWEKNITYTWNCSKNGCLLWVFYSSPRQIQNLHLSFMQAIEAAWHEIIAETKMTFDGLWLLYHKLTNGHVKKALSTMSGPVGAVAVWKYILSIWIWEYIAFIWSISLALAIFNILPIPALDGWRILTTAIMHIFRLKPKSYLVIENYISIFFFIILMWLWLYIMYLDYLRFY